MTTSVEITNVINTIFNTTWDSREGTVVPNTEDVNLSNGAVNLDAVFLYADLAHSTQLVRQFSKSLAAKVVRAYLSSMTRMVNDAGGTVRSFDGDRVMGVFVGDHKNTNAVRCGLKMHYVVKEILRPAAEKKFPSLLTNGFEIRHCVGIANGKVLVVRAGVRGRNDLVFIGHAPNIAAKLSELRTAYPTYITWLVYKNMTDAGRLGGTSKRNMWTKTTCTLADESWTCYKSNWTWSI